MKKDDLKNKILKILVAQKDYYRSGEEISLALGVTRTTVWKYVKLLRSEGFEIESISNKGYRLNFIPDKLEPVLIEHELQTSCIGRKTQYFASITSTNAIARELMVQDPAHGTLIIAEEQTQGKGRLGRSWISPFGTGIWMSIILTSDLKPSDAPKMTMIMAIAIVKAIEAETQIKVKIKWPNDIILDKRKLCGILTEMQADMDRIYWIIIGIGINVNQRADQFPDEISKIATSLYAHCGVKTSRIRLISRICNIFEALYEDFLFHQHLGSLLEEYKSLSITLGNQVEATSLAQNLVGRAENFDEDGALLIRTADGILHRIISGDVSVRGVNGYV